MNLDYIERRKLRILFACVGVAIANFTAGCSHLTIAPKPVNAGIIAFDENKQNAGVIDCGANGCLVTPNWIAKYRQMEKEFKNIIAADANIKTEGANYRISFEVFNHFASMKAAERGG